MVTPDERQAKKCLRNSGRPQELPPQARPAVWLVMALHDAGLRLRLSVRLAGRMIETDANSRYANG